MRTARRILAALFFAALAGTLLAVGVVGKWKGKVIIDASQLPRAQNPQQQKAMDNGLAGVKNMVIALDLRANKTFVATAKNLPGKTGAETNEGTWKQEGNTIFLTTLKSNGKPKQGKKAQKFLVTEGGKKIVLAADGMPPFMKVVFIR